MGFNTEIQILEYYICLLFEEEMVLCCCTSVHDEKNVQRTSFHTMQCELAAILAPPVQHGFRYLWVKLNP